MPYAVQDADTGTIRIAQFLDQLPFPENHEWLRDDILLFINPEQLEEWKEDF